MILVNKLGIWVTSLSICHRALHHQIDFSTSEFLNVKYRLTKNDTCGKNKLMYVKWQPSRVSTFTLNTDGSHNTATNSSGIGAVLRNFKGEFIDALSANVGNVSNNSAELWAIREGLKVCGNEGCNSRSLSN